MPEVKDDQFTWEAYAIIHVPTGARFAWSAPLGKSDHLIIKWNRTRTGSSGVVFDRTEVLKAAKALLRAKYPR